MINIDYSEIQQSDKLSNGLINIIGIECPHIMNDFKYSKVRVITVQSPFILADNTFDIAEANNTIEEINVKRNKVVCFTGGSLYIEYEKLSDDAYIIHGNIEEGFNIFNLI